MEGAEKMENKNELLKSQAAIRCAKAAILLSSLKSFPNRHLTAASNDQEEVNLQYTNEHSFCLFQLNRFALLFVSSRDYVFLQFVAGEGDDDDERNRRFEDEIGKGAVQEQEDQTLCVSGDDSSGHRASVYFDLLFGDCTHVWLKLMASLLVFSTKLGFMLRFRFIVANDCSSFSVKYCSCFICREL